MLWCFVVQIDHVAQYLHQRGPDDGAKNRALTAAQAANLPETAAAMA